MGYRIDVGCGSVKKEGCLGIDIQQLPEVDYVADLRVDPLPFPDRSVEYIYTHHFLEHLADPVNVLGEIGRVAMDGAQLEIWTPFAFSGSAFIFDHKLFWNEEHYLHLCVLFPDFWEKMLRSRWLLKEFRYIVRQETLLDLYQNHSNLDFAIRYYKDIVPEWGVFIEIQHDYSGPVPEFKRTWAVDRFSQPQPVERGKIVTPMGMLQNSASSALRSGHILRRGRNLLRRIYRRVFPK